jgi:hypothetical protein
VPVELLAWMVSLALLLQLSRLCSIDW